MFWGMMGDRSELTAAGDWWGAEKTWQRQGVFRWWEFWTEVSQQTEPWRMFVGGHGVWREGLPDTQHCVARK